jgi:hypothetical protein
MSSPTPPPSDPRRSDHLLEYFKTHAREIVAYIILILGIMLLFVNFFWGGVLVGIIAGIYFGDDAINFITHWKAGMDPSHAARQVIGAGVALAFFICAPAIFLGAAIAIGIKQLFLGQSST